MTVVGAIALLGIVWLGKQVLGALVSQQARGTLSDYVADRARAAATLLPPDLADDYCEEWLAELLALEPKPLSALRYAVGLERAARGIGAETGAFIAPNRRTAAFNRTVDITVSALVLVLLAPMFAVIGSALQVTGQGTFVRVRRIGDRGLFYALMFRTRRPGVDLRLTSVGRILEETGLEELPLLVNVLRGELSLIGPPAQPTRNGRCSAITGERRLHARPGLISWEVLQAQGLLSMSASEARRRDCDRGLKNDLRLMSYGAVTALVGRRRPRRDWFQL